MKILRSLAVASLILVSPVSFSQSPFDGSWRADPDTSSLIGTPDVFELTNGLYECKSCAPPYNVTADGHDWAVKGSPYYDTISVTIVDAHTVLKTAKKGGKTVAEVKASISSDNNTQTVHSKINTSSPQVELTQYYSRVAPGPAGSHVLSGSWQETRVDPNSDVTTFKLADGKFSRSNSGGGSYTAKVDGTEAPYKKYGGADTVSVKMIDDHTIEETDRRDGRIVLISRWHIDPDGKTMHGHFDTGHGLVTERSGHKVE